MKFHTPLPRTSAFLAPFLLACLAGAEIPKPTDAPQPLSPEESAQAFHLPPGFAMKLLAAEPLIREPSGVCWDERGRLFVSELHGYNVEGQYDIDELNKTGQLDLEVRRIQASDASKQRAEKEVYGTVKLLTDTDGDGVMDHAEVWADHLPPCYGLVPARGGVIVACAPDIIFLADRDGDGRAEVRERLFTGFTTGALERAVNAPTWGVDNWIYFGRGRGGGTVTGPHLAKPVVLGNTDFRIRADGSAIEPVPGVVKTVGMAFTEGGDRFVTNTIYPGYFVTPIPWRYLERNPDAPGPIADAPACDYQQVFPLAPPPPWRTKREQHAEYFAFYRKISLSDAAASGYFTSACSPLVYQDHVLPGLHGQYLACEPAQNLVHRALLERDGTRLRLKRAPGEEKSEFLASSDPWFHAIHLAPTPDGRVAVVDFYREIIEDYSAIPRHLQQQYGVIRGNDRGRLWLLSPTSASTTPTPDFSKLDHTALAAELVSPLQWHRLTARRLLIEQQARDVVPAISAALTQADAAPVLAALYTLEGLGALTAEHLSAAWQHPSGEVQRHVLQLADPHFTGLGHAIEKKILAEDFTATSRAPQVWLQLALSLGESRDSAVTDALIRLARSHGELRWMDAAIGSSARGSEKTILSALAADPGKAEPVMVNLAGIIAARGDAKEIEASIAALTSARTPATAKPLELLRLGLEDTKPLAAAATTPPLTAPKPEQLAALEKRVPDFVAALKGKPNPDEGRLLFQGICGACHRSHGLGLAVGPDLDAEFQRAPETIVRDVLFPHENIRPGYETIEARTKRGEVLTGIQVSDSPTSLTLRLPGGLERTLLRKRTSVSTLRNVSLMPFGLGDGLTPAQVANIIAFLRQP